MKPHGSGISININAHDDHGHCCSPGHDVLRVLDIATRDAIPPHHRCEGMWVLVLEEMTFYRLTGGLTNDCWVSCGNGSDGEFSPDDLPIASKIEKGIVRIGDHISVDADGLISVPAASDDTAGVVELASMEEVKAGTDNGKAVTPAGLADALVQDKIENPLPIASKTEQGIVQIGDHISVDADGLISVPAASDDTAGVVELASMEEVKAGTDNSKAVTPAGLADALVQDKVSNPLPIASKTQKGIVQIGDNINVDVDGLIVVPAASDDTAGVVELASVEESKIGADSTKAVTPIGLAAYVGSLPRPNFFIKGMILPFSGTFSDANPINPVTGGKDTSWRLCDGTNGTPNLRDRFIVGAGLTYAASSVGGTATHTHNFSGNVGATTLTVAQIPSHRHSIASMARFGGGGLGAARFDGNEVMQSNYAGGGGSHTHSLSIVPSSSASNLPPYYALAYIMYMGE